MLLAAYPKVFRVSADGIPATLRHIRPLVVRALGYAAFVVIVLFHFFLADALTGAGYQALRTAISAGAAVFNVCINMWIIPAYSWRGAAWSSIATDTLLLSAFATAAVGLARRSQHLVGRTKVIEARAEA
jgi:O-antigen/teichoic acid export membrane protein